jgi:hypothetical protein
MGRRLAQKYGDRAAGFALLALIDQKVTGTETSYGQEI